MDYRLQCSSSREPTLGHKVRQQIGTVYKHNHIHPCHQLRYIQDPPRHCVWPLTIAFGPFVDISQDDKVSLCKCVVSETAYISAASDVGKGRTGISAGSQPETLSSFPLISIDNNRVSLGRSNLDMSDIRSMDRGVVRLHHIHHVIVDRDHIILWGGQSRPLSCSMVLAMRSNIDDPESDRLIDRNLDLDYLWRGARGIVGYCNRIGAIARALWSLLATAVDSPHHSPEWHQQGAGQATTHELSLPC